MLLFHWLQEFHHWNGHLSWNSILIMLNLRGVPSVSSESTLCRRWGKENETPFHVIGSCPHNGLQISSRHLKVKHQLKQPIERKGYECYDEVFAVDNEGTRRFSDIVAFSTKCSTALIIDPTIRYETNDQNQCKLAQQEKQSIYEKCEAYYNSKFSHHYGYRKYEIHGLLFGARGAVSDDVLKFFKTFDLILKI